MPTVPKLRRGEVGNALSTRCTGAKRNGALQVVEARAPGGGPQRSHWQTVLPLMTKAPLPLEAGDTVVVSASASFGASGAEPPKYQLHADITHYS